MAAINLSRSSKFFAKAAKYLRDNFATPLRDATTATVATGAVIARALVDINGVVRGGPDVGYTSINPIGIGIGYAAGAGGAVTQASSASTGVTLNKLCGQITTVALTTAAAAEEVFTVTNSTVAATDVVIVSTTYAGGGTIQATTKKVAAGSFDICLANLHASAAFDALVKVNFAVIRAVSA